MQLEDISVLLSGRDNLRTHSTGSELNLRLPHAIYFCAINFLSSPNQSESISCYHYARVLLTLWHYHHIICPVSNIPKLLEHHIAKSIRSNLNHRWGGHKLTILDLLHPISPIHHIRTPFLETNKALTLYLGSHSTYHRSILKQSTKWLSEILPAREVPLVVLLTQVAKQRVNSECSLRIDDIVFVD